MIKWPSTRSEYELEDELTQTHIITRSKGFLHDAITQRLLSIRLRKTDLNYFLTVCEEAIAFYEESLLEPGISRPDMLSVELLFQKLQYLYYTGQGGKEEIFGSVPEIAEKLVAGRDAREMVRNWVDLLKGDWEFRFTFNYLLREGIYNNLTPYDDLIKVVRSCIP